MNTSERDTWVATALELFGTAAEVAGGRLGGPVGIVGAAIGLLTRVITDSIRNQGRSVVDIIDAIQMPREIDTSFQADIDARAKALPKKAPPK